jgi:GNAT superfamily N-acetyltransferase
MKTDIGLEIRPYRDNDEPRVLELLSASLGGGPAGRRPPEFFRWKHLESPFGRSFMLVAELDGRLVGLRAFMRWRFTARDRELRAVRAVDTATHPDAQGRGIFSELTMRALDQLKDEADLVFNTPNEKSLPGYLKMGWSVVGKIPISIRARRPVRVWRHRGSLGGESTGGGAGPPIVAMTAAQALREAEGLSVLVAEAESDDPRLHTPRNEEFVQWRYGTAPLLDYRCVAERTGDRLVGLALFRVRPRGRLWETTIADVIVRPGDRRSAARLLRRVTKSAPVDVATCSFPNGSTVASALPRNLFVRAPRGMTLVARPLRNDLAIDASDLRSWALSLGDLEVF